MLEANPYAVEPEVWDFWCARHHPGFKRCAGRNKNGSPCTNVLYVGDSDLVCKRHREQDVRL